MIAFRNVTARYAGAPENALADVSLHAYAGALTAVVGPNGSGKSTLVRTLLGRVALLSGQVTVDDCDLVSLSRGDVAKRIAVVIQREEPAFPMPVKEYVALGRYPHAGTWSRVADNEPALRRAFDVAGIAALRERRTDTLSGGEWQRVRIARALAQDTNAIVLDEPTTFLDVAHEMETFELLSRLVREGRTVLVVSHQLNLVARFADRVVLLRRGRVVAEGNPDEVMQARTLEAIYEWPLVVARDPVVGSLTLVPLRRQSNARNSDSQGMA